MEGRRYVTRTRRRRRRCPRCGAPAVFQAWTGTKGRDNHEFCQPCFDIIAARSARRLENS